MYGQFFSVRLGDVEIITHTYFVDQTVYNGLYNNGVITGTMSNPNSSLTGCFTITLDSSVVLDVSILLQTMIQMHK